jgi:hypothetical protein
MHSLLHSEDIPGELACSVVPYVEPEGLVPYFNISIPPTLRSPKLVFYASISVMQM